MYYLMSSRDSKDYSPETLSYPAAFLGFRDAAIPLKTIREDLVETIGREVNKMMFQGEEGKKRFYNIKSSGE